MAGRPRTSTERGQSSVIGVVILIGIVFAGISAVVMFGGSALTGLEHSANVDRATTAMTQFDSRASSVVLGDAASARVGFGDTGTDGRLDTRSAGWLEVTLANSSGETVLANESLGEFVYEVDDDRVAYQGGGVWRAQGGGVTMVSPPEFHYRDTTLTLPIVSLDGDDSLSGSDGVTVRDDGYDEVTGFEVPLREGSVNVTVQSRYYEAWGRFFEDRTEGTVRYDHAAETATLTLVTPVDSPQVTGGVVSTGGGTEMDLDNNVRVNSYNSSAGETPNNGYTMNDNNGRIVSTGEVTFNSGNVKVAGDLLAGGDIAFEDDQPELRGDALCARDNPDCVDDEDESQVRGDVNNTDSTVPEPSPVGDLVADKLRDAEARNDNDATPRIDDGRLDWTGTDTVTLDAGSYYLRSIEMADTGNQELVLDTSGGDVELAVGGNVHLDGTNITVEGDGVARVFADVGDEGDGDVDLDNGATVRVVDGSRTYNSTQFWLYAPPNVDADIQSDSEFTGVLYAPGGRDAEAKVDIVGSTVSGAIVAPVSSMDEDSGPTRIHYDEALEDATAVRAANAEAPRVTYMHITVNEIRVEP
jgi:flagellin-like protein